MRQTIPLKTTSLALASLIVAGCAAVGPSYEAPETPEFVPTELAQDEAVGATGDEPAHDWWRSFGDPTLDDLVATAFAQNRDLRSAAASVAAARANFRLARSNRRPQGELAAAYERRRLAGAAFGIDDAAFPDTDFFNLGGSAAWELDFFGRVRRTVEASFADAQVSEALRRDAQVMVAAETVGAYIDYRGAELQLTVARQNLDVQRQTLSLTQTRYEEGAGSLLDVARAEAQTLTTQATLPPIEAAAAAAANRLATLLGQSVDDILSVLGASQGALPSPPQVLAIGDPTALIERRADVRAAERAFAAATARIGVAKANFFPRISLLGSIGASSQSLSGLGDEPAFGYGIGPSLSWAGFDMPRVRAQLQAAGAQAEAAFADYEAAVLLAVQETQTALAAYGRERVRYEALRAAAKTSREASELARVRYDNGIDDFIDVLDAESRQLEVEASLAVSVTAIARRYADVFRALGAGWAI